MMPFLSLFVPCIPAGQPRARAGVVNGRARVFNPSTVKTALGRKPHPAVEFKHSVRMAVSEATSRRLLDGPLRVDLEFVFPRPASITKKTRPNPSIPHTKKPDRDNLDKAVLDSLTGLLWNDDCQVCDGRIRKRIAAAGEEPGVRIAVTEIVEA